MNMLAKVEGYAPQAGDDMSLSSSLHHLVRVNVTPRNRPRIQQFAPTLEFDTRAHHSIDCDFRKPLLMGSMSFSCSSGKQHLRIKAFFGTSENAVKTQIWVAVSVYVLVAIARKRLSLDLNLYQTLQILSVPLFEKTPILQALQPQDSQPDLVDTTNQLNLFTL